MTPVLVKILNAGQLLVSFLVLGEELAMKIKSHFELDPSFTVSTETLSGQAVQVDDATMDSINAWRQSVGLSPLAKS